MLKSEVSTGKTYRVRISGNFVDVRLNEIVENEGRSYMPSGNCLSPYNSGRVTFRGSTRYLCTNLKTGRDITIKSAAKFHREVTQTEMNCR